MESRARQDVTGWKEETAPGGGPEPGERPVRRGRWCAVAAWVVALAALLPAAPAALTASQFQARMQAWQQQVNALGQHPDGAAALAKGLPPELRVEQDGKVLQVSTAWLRRGLQQFTSDSKHRNKDLAELEAGIGERLRLAQAAPANAPDLGAARGTLRRILARREFRGVHPPSRAQQAKSRIWAWIVDHLNRIAKSIAPHSKILGWAIWIITLLGMGVAVWYLLRYARERQSRRGPGPLPAERPSATPWQTWRGEAKQAAAEGNFRDGIHLAYWAGISWLEQEGAWMPDRARTPREYLRLLPAQSPWQGRLRALTARFEQAWYAGQPAVAADFDAMLHELEDLGCR